MNAGLELRDLACVRGRRSLFRGLNATLAPGQLLRVSGANGAGKTSLLRMLCGLLAPAQGQVLWQGAKRAALARGLPPAADLPGPCGSAEGRPEPAGEPAGRRPAGRHGAGRRGGTPGPGRCRLARPRAGAVAHTCRRASAGAPRWHGCRWAQALLWVLDEPFNALDTAATAWLLGLIEAHLRTWRPGGADQPPAGGPERRRRPGQPGAVT